MIILVSYSSWLLLLSFTKFLCVPQSCMAFVCYTFQVSDVPVIADAGEAGGITPIYRKCNHWVEIRCRHWKVLRNIHNHVIELLLLHLCILSLVPF